MHQKRSFVFLAIMFIWLVTACAGGSQPKLLASFPSVTPIAVYPDQVRVAYNAYIELSVSDVDRAAERAIQKAYDFGGYLENSQSWYVDNRKNTSLILAVPAYNFELLRQSLLGLGSLVSEKTSGERIPPRDYEPQYSHITLHLHPSGIALPQIDVPTWRPFQTLRSAFGVFLSIFGFLVDILIWVIVVAGPFALLGWLGWRLTKRVREPSTPVDKAD
jgi:hypothetical protein